MSSFNEAQKNAILHKDGPMMVLAGPGSGKTLVITHRTRQLIERYGVHPSNILVITFTKAAAKQMKDRFHKLAGDDLPVAFGTFHSIFFQILKHAYHYTSSNVLAEETKKQYLREIIERLSLEIDDEAEFIQNIVSEISLVKSEMITLNHYYSTSCADEIFQKIYRMYDDRLVRNNQIDFDDMLVFTYQLFRERPDILKLWQKRFPYILIDEYQDINKVQYEVIRMLAAPKNNLFIVGDDDQSIYRFRGANPEIMLGFERDYRDAKKVLLDINYRSTRNIVEGAKRVIKHNTKRFPKNIQAFQGEKEEIEICKVHNQAEENADIIEKIRDYNRKGMLFSQMAVLFRTNTQPRLLIERLMEYNIPFVMRDGIPNLYEHWIAKNLITYIELAIGSRDRAKFLSIMNRPKRYLSREYFQNPEVSFSELKNSIGDKKWMLERVEQLEADLARIAKMTPYAAIHYIRKGIGYEEYLAEYAVFRRMKVEDLLVVTEEIQESARAFQTFQDWFDHIEKHAMQLKEQGQKREKETDSVTLTTMHSAKGLEYDAVFILDANEGITPHKKSVKDADLEEERRMFYVAMTRAKEYLTIYSLEELYGKKVNQSRFLGELLFDQEELSVGSRIQHKKYGIGTITYVDGDKMSIYFDHMKDTRTLSVSYTVANELVEFVKK